MNELGRNTAGLAALEELNLRRFEFIILHGAENLPKHLGRDLDVLLVSGFHDLALQLCASTLLENGYDKIAFPPKTYGHRIVAVSSRKDLRPLEIHFVRNLSWRFFNLKLEPDDVRIRKGLPHSPALTFFKGILMPLLSKNFQGIETRMPAMTEDFDNDFAVELLGVKLAQELQDALSTLDSTKFLGLRGAISRKIYMKSLRSPKASLKGVWLRCVRFCRELFSSATTPVILSHFPTDDWLAAVKARVASGETIFVDFLMQPFSNKITDRLRVRQAVSRQWLVVLIREDSDCEATPSVIAMLDLAEEEFFERNNSWSKC